MSRRPAIPFILVTLLIDVMGIGLLLPVLPALVGEFTASRDAQTYWYGAMIVTFGLTQFVCSPLLGAISDRFGRRPVLLGSIAGLGTMFLLSALAMSLTGLLLARVLGGALAANFAVANAYVADLTAPENRARSFGLVGAAFGVGYIVGPMVGGLLGSIDIRLPFYAAATLSGLNFLYGLLLVPESLPPERRKPIQLAPRESGCLAVRPGTAARRRRAGGRHRARQSRPVHPVQHLGAVHEFPFRLGPA